MFFLENIKYGDEMPQARAEAFLLAHTHPGVRPRPKDQLDRALDSGQGFALREGEDFCGISLVYQYDPRPDDPVHYEIGTMRIITGGFGLQVFVAYFHLIQTYFENDSADVPVFAVVEDGTASQHNLHHHVGMTPSTPPNTVALLRRGEGVPFDPAKQVLFADVAHIRRAFSELGALHIQNGCFRTPKSNGLVQVTMPWFEPALLQHGP